MSLQYICPGPHARSSSNELAPKFLCLRASPMKVKRPPFFVENQLNPSLQFLGADIWSHPYPPVPTFSTSSPAVILLQETPQSYKLV